MVEADSITFFDDGRPVRRKALEPIAEAAADRGYDVWFSEDLSAEANVGVYNSHLDDIDTINADLSCVMFHGIDDGIKHSWISDCWGMYDVGFLPGNVAASNWRSKSWHPKARPSIGVFPVGWPKADKVVSEPFRERLRAERRELSSNSGPSILYAPSGDDSSERQMSEFLDAAEETFALMLIKQHPDVDDLIPDALRDRVDADERVHVLDPERDIMECLALADVMVTEESSVLIEALLTDTIPVSVLDWPFEGDWSPESKTVPDAAVRTTRSELADTLADVVDDRDRYLDQTADYRANYFNNVGSAAEKTVDVIDAIVHSRTPPVAAVDPVESRLLALRGLVGYNLANVLRPMKKRVSDSVPSQARARLRETRANQGLNRAIEWMEGKA